jgi:replicative superfamily II helicase
MVDFERLRAQKGTSRPIDPMELFRHLPKPPGINDLYSSQAEVLSSWFDRRNEKDLVLKLHTGGGKTLVGLLIAQSSLNETKEPVLYLAPTVQLVNQTIEKATAIGIKAIPYTPGQALQEEFVNGQAILVASYKALFNGKSKFGIRGIGIPQKVSCIVLDDAHTSFSIVRDSFTIDVKAKDDRDTFETLCGLFRQSLKERDR